MASMRIDTKQKTMSLFQINSSFSFVQNDIIIENWGFRAGIFCILQNLLSGLDTKFRFWIFILNDGSQNVMNGAHSKPNETLQLYIITLINDYPWKISHFVFMLYRFRDKQAKIKKIFSQSRLNFSLQNQAIISEI